MPVNLTLTLVSNDPFRAAIDRVNSLLSDNGYAVVGMEARDVPAPGPVKSWTSPGPRIDANGQPINEAKGAAARSVAPSTIPDPAPGVEVPKLYSAPVDLDELIARLTVLRDERKARMAQAFDLSRPFDVIDCPAPGSVVFINEGDRASTAMEANAAAPASGYTEGDVMLSVSPELLMLHVKTTFEEACRLRSMEQWDNSASKARVERTIHEQATPGYVASK